MNTTLTETQKSALAFLTGTDGCEPRAGLSALEIADVIVNVAQHAVEARVASQDLRGASELSAEEKADLNRLLGVPSTSRERMLLVRTLRVLLPE